MVLGRAAAIVLADHPNALHVRLHGPRERRLERVIAVEVIEREEAERRMADNDRAREATSTTSTASTPATRSSTT